MKQYLFTGIALITASLMITPSADAQSRGRDQGNRHNSTVTTTRPGRSQSSKGTQSNVRPNSGNNKRNDGYTRPSSGNKPTTGNLRPGQGNGNQSNKPSQGNKPGNNKPNYGSNKPGGGHNNAPSYGKPGNNKPEYGNNKPNYGKPNHGNPNYGKPGHGTPGVQKPNPGYRPPQHGANPDRVHYRPGSHPSFSKPTVRPGRPTISHWNRPVPPARWQPRHRGTLLGNILGLTFGVAINTALDNLYYSGYAINGYVNNQVYLTDITQFNMYWPDATLFFDGNGLARSQFYMPSMGYDISYYNNAYANLCSMYGMPVSHSKSGYAVTSTWFGGAGDYISLQIMPMASGNYRYFTILTVGR